MKKKRKIRKIVKSNYFRHFLCLFFVCINILIIGVVIIIKHHGINYYSVQDLINHVFPGLVFLGLLSWLAGLILDNPRKRMIIDYKDLIYEELLKTNNKISPEELDRKLKISTNEEENDETENFPFEDAEMNIGESEIEL